MVSDMQSKDTKVQQIMWTNLNETMLKHEFPKLEMAFNKLNVVPQSQAVVVQHCKKTLNITTKPKSFQNKQIMVFQLHVMLVTSL
jgi:hypothetical protein